MSIERSNTRAGDEIHTDSRDEYTPSIFVNALSYSARVVARDGERGAREHLHRNALTERGDELLRVRPRRIEERHQSQQRGGAPSHVDAASAWCWRERSPRRRCGRRPRYALPCPCASRAMAAIPSHRRARGGCRRRAACRCAPARTRRTRTALGVGARVAPSIRLGSVRETTSSLAPHREGLGPRRLARSPGGTPRPRIPCLPNLRGRAADSAACRRRRRSGRLHGGGCSANDPLRFTARETFLRQERRSCVAGSGRRRGRGWAGETARGGVPACDRRARPSGGAASS